MIETTRKALRRVFCGLCGRATTNINIKEQHHILAVMNGKLRSLCSLGAIADVFPRSAGFDRGNVFAVPVLGARGPASSAQGSERGAGGNGNAPQVKPSETIKQCYEFIQQFRQDESFIYRLVVGISSWI